MTGLQNTFVYKARASRAEYWTLTLTLALLFVIIFSLIPWRKPGPVTLEFRLFVFFLLALSLPFWSASVRRLHDVGMSGWYALLLPVGLYLGVLANGLMGLVLIGVYGSNPSPDEFEAIPNGVDLGVTVLTMSSLLVGPSLLGLLCLRRSQPGPNKYGPNPNEVPQ